MDLFSYEPRSYPHAPGHRGVDTSRKAAEEIAPKQSRLQAMVLSAVRAAGARGLTPDEAAATLDLSILTVRPRFTELKLKGLIRDSGQRRLNGNFKSAIAWIAAGTGC